MIPPIVPTILDSNPNFARVHSRLTSTLLAPDGSTTAINNTHIATASALHRHQIEAARDEILKNSLSDLVGLKSSINGAEDFVLPAPLRELIYTISLYITEGPSMNLSADDHELMAAEVEEFRAHLPQIAEALSDHLEAQHDALLAIAAQTEIPQPGSSPRTSNPSLPNRIGALQAQISPNSTLAPFKSTISTLLTLMPIQSACLTAHITHLQRHIHGTLSRHSQTKASYLAAVAKALAFKARIMHLSTLKATYSPDMQSALGNYAEQLREGDQRLREREDALRRILEEYDGVKLREGERGGDGRAVMRQLGLKYGETIKEIEEVQSDVRNLENEFVVRRPNR